MPRPDAAVRERRLAAVAFVATAISIVLVHRVQASGVGSWVDSVLFSGTLLGVLGAHELGHHVVGRWRGLTPSLPLFLPAPFFVGTLGALLSLRGRARTRGDVVEMAVAGPLAGFAAIVACGVVRFAVLGAPAPAGISEVLSQPLLWQLLAAGVGGSVPLTTADPIGYAMWVGCLVTAMNLLPIGQLDGGHTMRALFPKVATRVSVLTGFLLFVAGFAWGGWWAWLVAIALLAARRPLQVSLPDRPPQWRAFGMAAATILVFVLTVMPIPW